MAPVEHLEITGDGFCGVHRQGARIPPTAAIPAPAGELITRDGVGSEHLSTAIVETSSATIATGNARLIAANAPMNQVKIAYRQ